MIIIDGVLCGNYKFRDTLRHDTEEFIHHLITSHGLKKIMIVSGDRFRKERMKE